MLCLFLAILLVFGGVSSGINAFAEDYTNSKTLDFEDGVSTGWEPGNAISATASIATAPAGMTGKALKASVNSAGILIGKSLPAFADGEFETKINLSSANNRVALVFRYVNENQWASFAYDTNGDWFLVWNGGDYYTSCGTGKVLQLNTTYTVKAVFKGQNYELYLDGVQVFKGTNSEMPTAAGNVGIRCWYQNNNVFLDDLTIRYNAATQPIVITYAGAAPAPAHKLSLWYRQPATTWESQALPIGNGSIGGMIYGGVDIDRIQFNEESLWTGGPGGKAGYSNQNTGVVYNFGKKSTLDPSKLSLIRQYLKNGQTAQAQSAMSYLLGTEYGYGNYQNFGEILLKDNNIAGNTTVQDYRRELDLEDGVARTTYKLGGVTYTKEYFVSYPDDVMVIRLTSSDASAPLNINVGYKPGMSTGATVSASGNTLSLNGKLTDNQLQFESRLKVYTEGGQVAAGSDALTVTGTQTAYVVMNAATNYENIYPTYRSAQSAAQKVDVAFAKVEGKTFAALKQTHTADYRALYGRVTLDLGAAASTVPTDALLNAYKANPNRTLEEIFFQYGRYLLMSSSRPGSLPANLQGVWNTSNTPPWASDYHFNINLQMNYWPAEVTNLSETTKPLIDFIKAGLPAYADTAKAFTGVQKGWMINCSGNIFGLGAVGWDWSWGWSPSANAFISQNIWESYDFNRNKDTLRNEIYPILKGASEFWLDFLYEDENGKLMSSPSYSPENGPLAMGTAYDQELIWELFTNTIEACDTLGVDAALKDRLVDAKARLWPVQVGTFGQIMEWKDNPTDAGGELQHRHVSQLVGLYPGKQINEDERPDLFAAAKVTLNRRGDAGTGWSKAWKVNFWARLKDGDRALKILSGQLSDSTLTNLFDTHPPFQIDGNFGGTSGMAEMLVQSHMDYIDMLPSLPTAWGTGRVTGLRARGGYTVDMNWVNMALKEATVTPDAAGPCRVKYGAFKTPADYKITSDDGSDVASAISDGIITFQAEQGKKYRLTAAENPIESIQAGNGYALVKLNQDGSGLTADKLQAGIKVGAAASTPLTIRDFTYNKDTNTIGFGFVPMYTATSTENAIISLSINDRAPVQSNTFTITTSVGIEKIDDRSSRVIYQGTWYTYNDGGDYSGTEKYTTQVNATASLTFDGTGIRFISMKQSNMNLMDVYIDNELVRAGINCYNPTTIKQVVLYEKLDLTPGQHTIKVVNSSTIANRVAAVDAFEVITSPVVIEDMKASRDTVEVTLSQSVAAQGADFVLTYSADGGAWQPLSATVVSQDNRKAILSFPAIPAAEKLKTVVLSCVYKGSPKVFASPFLVFDMSPLAALIAQAEGLDSKPYRTDTWEVLVQALASAKTLMAKPVGAVTLAEYTETCQALKSAIDSLVIKVTGLKTGTASVISLKRGRTLQLVPVWSPQSVEVLDIEYASANTAVATVSQTGLITGLKAGMALVTLIAKDGSGAKAQVVVNVIS